MKYIHKINAKAVGKIPIAIFREEMKWHMRKLQTEATSPESDSLNIVPVYLIGRYIVGNMVCRWVRLMIAFSFQYHAKYLISSQ